MGMVSRPVSRQKKQRFFKLTGKKLVRKMSAFDLKELARTKRENGEPLPPVLQQLDTQLTEESNPVLIIGNLHKMDGVDGNGKPTSFTTEETEILKGALVDLSERIRRAADSI